MNPGRLLIVAVALSLLAACESGTALEGEKFYIQSGIGRATMPRDIAAVDAAAVAALRDDLGYRIISHEIDGESGVITARGSRSRTVKVQTWRQGDGETKLQIGMGARGSDLVVRNIMSKIEARLKN